MRHARLEGTAARRVAAEGSPSGVLRRKAFLEEPRGEGEEDALGRT